MQRPEWLNTTEYPYKANYFALAEGQMHYVDEGKGEAIVMIHGTPEWSFAYRHVIKAFQNTYRCIVPDHLGFGLSDKPEGANYSPEKQAQRLELFLNELKLESFTLIVHDFGGPIGLAYAQKYPEKIKRLILMNTWLWGLKQDPYYAYFSRFMHTALGKWLYLQLSFSARFIMKSAFADKRKLPKEVHAQYLKVFPTPKSRQATLAYAQSFMGSDTWFESLWQNKEQLKAMPAQIIWGLKDPAFKLTALKKLETIFETCQTHKLENTGHFPQEESPELIIPLIKSFLETPKEANNVN